MTNTEKTPLNSRGGRLRGPQQKPHIGCNLGTQQLVVNRLSVPKYGRRR